MYRLFLLSIILFVLGGCGYRPLAHGAKKSLGRSVSSEIIISMQDPENSVEIKDALDKALIQTFQTHLVAKGDAKTHLKVSLQSIEVEPITYDINGFISRYQLKVTLSVRVIKKIEGDISESKIYNTIGYHMLKTDVISDVERYNAIKSASQRALESFISQVVIED